MVKSISVPVHHAKSNVRTLLPAQCPLSPSIIAVDTCARSQLPNFPQNHVIYGTVCYDRQDLCVTTVNICAARSNNLWNNHTCMCVLNDEQLNETLVVIDDIKYSMLIAFNSYAN